MSNLFTSNKISVVVQVLHLMSKKSHGRALHSIEMLLGQQRHIRCFVLHKSENDIHSSGSPVAQLAESVLEYGAR
jgi:hypothetical protein